MELELRELQKKDYGVVIEATSKGMHFDWYMDSEWLRRMYGKFFLYTELMSATHILSAYYGDDFAGLLVADVNGEDKVYKSFSGRIYRAFFKALEKLGGNGADSYDKANDRMLAEYLKTNSVDGEISFLVANPDLKIKGTGTFLLNELSKQVNGKRIYLYTDEACTYEFYEHRGFERNGEENIVLDLPKGKIPLKCFLYTKEI